MAHSIGIHQFALPPALVNLLHNADNVALVDRELTLGSRIKGVHGTHLFLGTSRWHESTRFSYAAATVFPCLGSVRSQVRHGSAHLWRMLGVAASKVGC